MIQRQLQKLLCVLLSLSLSGIAAFGQSTVIWQIGASDNQSSGMALAPSDYKKFLEHDFGWEDRYYLIGHSTPEKDFPYVLPGPKDSWGGTAPTSGIRSHFLNLLFTINKISAGDRFELVIDMLSYDGAQPPLFKVHVSVK